MEQGGEKLKMQGGGRERNQGGPLGGGREVDFQRKGPLLLEEEGGAGGD